MNNQYRLKASTDAVLAWFELRRLWTSRKQEATLAAMHTALDELIKLPQLPNATEEIHPLTPRI